MATLTKSQPALPDDSLISISSSIPAPFSSADRAYIIRSTQNHPITPTSVANGHPLHAQESQVSGDVLLNTDRGSPTANQVSFDPVPIVASHT